MEWMISGRTDPMNALKTLLLTTLVCFGAGCNTLEEDLGTQHEKESGWVGADSYEVGAIVKGAVSQTMMGEWSELADDAELQTKLVDLQIKFAKTTAEKYEWRFNQLTESIIIEEIYIDGDEITIEYSAVIDMLGRLRGNVPKLQQLDPIAFTALVPIVPEGFSESTMLSCAHSDEHRIRAYNFHYYFKPEKEECDLALTDLAIEITEVFDRPRTYPEYDRLLNELPSGDLGFTVALVPNRGDRDPMSRFESHAEMLEQDLGLIGVEKEGGFTRYEWRRNGVAMIIDLYDPTQVGYGRGFEDNFRARLKDYTLVHYNGHSSYGSKHLLDDPDAYSDDYQIIVLHSCQSYAYYTRQVFRGKATAEDPKGFDGADIVATGKSSYPSGAPRTLNVLLEHLMLGIDVVANGQPNLAPDWITIAEKIKRSTWGDILYGVAGVRSNTWTP